MLPYIQKEEEEEGEFLKILIIFSNIMFLSTFEALIHSIWTCYEKVMNNLVFRHSKHLIEKKTYRSHF